MSLIVLEGMVMSGVWEGEVMSSVWKGEVRVYVGG